jgi:hypothetical protein
VLERKNCLFRSLTSAAKADSQNGGNTAAVNRYATQNHEGIAATVDRCATQNRQYRLDERKWPHNPQFAVAWQL